MPSLTVLLVEVLLLLLVVVVVVVVVGRMWDGPRGLGVGARRTRFSPVSGRSGSKPGAARTMCRTRSIWPDR